MLSRLWYLREASHKLNLKYHLRRYQQPSDAWSSWEDFPYEWSCWPKCIRVLHRQGRLGTNTWNRPVKCNINKLYQIFQQKLPDRTHTWDSNLENAFQWEMSGAHRSEASTRKSIFDFRDGTRPPTWTSARVDVPLPNVLERSRPHSSFQEIRLVGKESKTITFFFSSPCWEDKENQVVGKVEYFIVYLHGHRCRHFPSNAKLSSIAVWVMFIQVQASHREFYTLVWAF